MTKSPIKLSMSDKCLIAGVEKIQEFFPVEDGGIRDDRECVAAVFKAMAETETDLPVELKFSDGETR